MKVAKVFSSPEISPLHVANYSANSSMSSIEVGGTYFGGSSEVSLVSSYAPSPSIQPQAFRFEQRRGKESAIKRYLRSKFCTDSAANLSTTSMVESKMLLDSLGVSSVDHINLYNVCFALSASLTTESTDPAMASRSSDQIQSQICVVCSDDACLWEECQRNLSSNVSLLDHYIRFDAEGNTNLHRAVRHGRKVYVAKLLDGGVDPSIENAEGMNAAVYGWGFLLQHRDNEEKYANIWVSMLRVLEKQRENKTNFGEGGRTT